MTLPNFLVIGAAKSGTSSLHHYLRAHPQVFTPKLKEINFFAYDGQNRDFQCWAKTLEEYESKFEGGRGATAVGEVTPLYFASPVAPGRIRSVIPDVKLVAILRDPVERAYSAYLMSLRSGRISADVRTAFGNKNAAYIVRGRYAHYLQRYYELFSKEQIKILRFEDLRRNPSAVTADLYGFLGVDRGFEPQLEVHNKGYVPRNRMLNRVFHSDFARRVLKPIMSDGIMKLARKVRSINEERPPELPADVRAELRVFYHDDIARLQELTAMDFSSWFAEPRAAVLMAVDDRYAPRA
jgi:hypothetical protein